VNGFVFPLRGLLNYRKNRRDLCRMLLAQLLADDRSLAADRTNLTAARAQQLDEIRRINERRPLPIDASATRRYHSIQLLARIRGVDERRELLAGQLRLCREALTRADADVKALERLEEKQLAAFLYEANRREQREREDLWSARRLVEQAQ
jgi:flagellar protein FliJ